MHLMNKRPSDITNARRFGDKRAKGEGGNAVPLEAVGTEQKAERGLGSCTVETCWVEVPVKAMRTIKVSALDLQSALATQPSRQRVTFAGDGDSGDGQEYGDSDDDD